MAMTKIKALQQWCRKMTEGYPHVDISNFTSSWRDGLAFCALIHKFRPDLIDYDSLSPDNVFENNKLAFEVGEAELNIPAFLEADDMARLKVPDKLSVITYVSQYYNNLHHLPQLGGPGVKGNVKKSSTSGTKRPPDNAKVPSEPSNKKTVASKDEAKHATNSISSSPRKGTVGDKCSICQNKVYLLERHIEGGKLYHRSCYRHSELSPTNKVFTKSPFMSPSLSNQKAHLEKPNNQDTPVSWASDNHVNYNDSKNVKGNENSLLSDLKSGLKRVAGGESTHSIESDKVKEEDSKRAKVQPRTLFGGKENLKTTTTAPKTEEASFPLSGKEAKKLEKRRQELISSEASTPASKGAKRGMPLIFQKNDNQVSSSSSSNTNTPSEKSSSSSLFSSSSNTDTKSKSSTPVLSNETLGTPRSTTTVANKAVTSTGVHNSQEKFSTHTESAQNKDTSHLSHPVARPRVTGSKVASSPFMDNSSSKKSDVDVTSVTPRNKETFPKVVPRKSLIENKDQPKVSSSSVESLHSDDGPPPALPFSPPPSLPSSKPPPLPDSAPPPVVKSSYQSSASNQEASVNESSSKSKSKSPSPIPTKDRKDHPQEKLPHQIIKHPPSSSLPAGQKPARPPPPVSPPQTQQEPVATLVTPAEKKKDTSVLSGLLTSLAGVRGRSASTPGNSVPSTSTPTSTTRTAATTISLTTLKTATTTTTTSSTADASTNVSSLSNRKQSEPALKGLAGKGKTSLSTDSQCHDDKNSSSSSVTPVQISLNPTTASSSNQSSKTGAPEAVNILNSLKPVAQNKNKQSSSQTIATPDKQKAPSNTSKIQTSEEFPKPKSRSVGTENEVKVGNLVKNYVSKSKEDLSSRNNSKEQDSSKSAGLFKKPFTPAQTKNISKDQIKPDISPSTTPKSLPRLISGSRENLTHMNDIKLKPVPSQSKPQDFKPEDESGASQGFGVKLNKVGTPAGQVEEKTNSAKPDLSDISGKGRETTSDSDATKLGSDIPQWKKDIEERKRKLKEDIIKSEKPKWNERRVGKEKSESNVIPSSTESSIPRDGSLCSTSDRVPGSDALSLSGKSSPHHNDTNLSSEGEKLNWQKEAERRMAAFAQFDNMSSASEDESKTREDDTKEMKKLREVEARNAELKKKNEKSSDSKTKLKEVEVPRHKVVLKSVDIDISGEDKEEEKGKQRKEAKWIKRGGHPEPPTSLSLNHNNSRLEEEEEEKTTRDGAKPAATTKDNGRIAGGLVMDKGKKSSPEVKRKITVLGPKNQEEPTTPVRPEKKKIVVTGQFDFDATTPSSDFESSLTLSTEQMSIHDGDSHHQATSTPIRPPRPKSLRKKESPSQISAIELQQQLMEIDNRLTHLELRGRDLEDSIRNASFLEGSEADEDEDDRLMKEWFQLVSDKNDLVRQEADLVYLSREQELEGEQEQIDAQLRYLISKDEATKSPQEKEEEVYLLKTKLDIVNQRSSIIDSMDEDRIRYEEEDRGIEHMLKSKGLWKDDGTILAEKGKKVAKSKFYT